MSGVSRKPESPDRPFYLHRDFDAVTEVDGTVRYVPKGAVIRELGKPPWTLELPDLSVVPDECTDMVGAVVWRGVRFTRERSHDWDVSDD